MSKTKLSERELYLYNTLRLSHDPFAYAVAELELQANDIAPLFFSYFVDLPFQPDKSLLEAIKELTHTTVFGKVGSGKTTLRYALEAACRAVPDRTLVISLEVGKSYSSIFTEQTTNAALLEALATDLFVQLLEQYHLFQDILTPELIHELSHFWQANIPAFRRRLTRWLKQGEPTESLIGISKWWTVWHRTIVSYTPLTKERNTFLQRLLSTEMSAAYADKFIFQEGVELAQAVGYKRIYVLVDVAGAIQVNQQFLPQLDHILKNTFNNTFSLPLYLKGFLPLESEALLKENLQSYKQLTSPTVSAIMDWENPELLQGIIVNRFRSAGSLIKGFEAIASQKIVHRINTALTAAANESPRRLLQLASLLITVHAQRDLTDPVITAEDWQKMCQLWGFGSPEPTLPLNAIEH